MNQIQNQSNKGGEAIASGGFGCVFSPALKCKNKKRKTNFISKLMTKKYALEEYKEIKNVNKKLNSIPNYENYFLIYDFNLCEPDKLSNSDLKNFGKKCTALPKNDITQKNINENLNKIFALNMPYGGLPIDDYLYKNITYPQIIDLNDSLIELLNRGILPMNQKHIYHGDIKDSNILVDSKKEQSTLNTRLIDWGLTTEYIPFKEEKFPDAWKNRPLQYNVPFSVILFTDDFVEKYTEFVKEEGNDHHDVSKLKPFIMDYIYFWLKTRGNGHYKYINHIMYMMFSKDMKSIYDEKTKTRIIESDFTLFYLSNYLIEILVHFTHFRENETLNLRVYLDNVYIHLLDVWGWITCYLPIMEILFENYEKLNENELLLFDQLKKLFLKYLYEPRIKPIDIQSLTQDFKDLDKIFDSLSEKKKKSVLSLKSSLGNQTKVTGLTVNILKSTKKKRLFIKKNRTKRNSYLLFADLKKDKKVKKTKK
jgi:serine/threonine protein kinase